MTTPSKTPPAADDGSRRRPASSSVPPDFAVFDAFPDGICVLDATGVVLGTNGAWRQFAAQGALLAPNAAVGASYFAACQAVAGDAAPAAREGLRGLQAVARGDLPVFLLDYPTGQRWFELRAAPWKRGRAACLIVIQREITERKRAEELHAGIPHAPGVATPDGAGLKATEEALRASEERLRLAQESAHVGVWDWDLESGRVEWTPELERIYGFEPGTFPGAYAAFSQRVHPEDLAEVERRRDAAVAAHEAFDFDFRLRLPAGEIRWVNCTGAARYAASGRPQRVFGVNVDISARKRAEATLQQLNAELEERVAERTAALRKSQQQYRAVVEDQTETICRFKADGTLTFVNEVYCRFFGKSNQELVGTSWRPRAVGEDLPIIEAKLRTLSARNPVVVIENRVYAATGEVRWMQFVNRGLFDDAGRLVETQAVGRDITERKQTEQALRQSEERFRVALAAAPIVIFNQDRDLRYTWVGNPALGLSAEQALGRTDEELLGAEAARPLAAIKRRVLETGRGERREVLVSRAGQSGWFELMAEPLRDAGGVVGVTCAAVDVTERKRMEQALRESEELYRLLFVAESDAVFLVDRETGRFVEANPSAERMYGYSREQFLALKVADISAEPETSLQAIQGEVTAVPLRRHRRKDGSVFPVEISGGYLNWSGRRMHVAAIRDITERKQAEAALQASERLLRLILDNIPDPAWMKDIEGRFLAVNKSWCHFIGLMPEQAIGRSDLEVFPPDVGKRFREQELGVAAAGQILRAEEVLRDAAGRPHHFETIKAPLTDAAGRVYATIGIARDITERKRAEAALRESEERFRTLVEEAPEGIFIQARRQFAYLNGAMVRLLGASGPDQVLGELVESRIHPDYRAEVRERIRRLNDERLPVPLVDEVLLRMDGSPRDVSVSAVPFEFKGEPGALVFVRDITVRKRVEAERAEAVARLAVVEEQERHRVSRELHDQTAQRLVALALELKSLETHLAAGRPQADRVRSLRQAVDDLQLQVRQIAWNLRAGELVDGGLECALPDYIEDWSERARVAVDCECRGLGDQRLPARIEATLYRVAQEALANVEKHARAHHVGVLLERDASLARLTVEDDGCGFDADAAPKSSDAAHRLGLLGMRERVALAGGSLVIESSPGAGTTLLVRIPIPTQSKV